MSADLDKAIDHAVREMLDVEPAAGLRRRVLDQLPASGSQVPASGFQLPALSSLVASTFRWKILLPVAAAAVVILALLLPRSTPRRLETTIVSAPPAPATTTPVQRPALGSAPVEVASGQPRPEPARRVVAAAASTDVMFDAPPAPGFPRLPALSVPALNVSSIQRVVPVDGPDAIATDPIATPSPLAIEPLSAQGRQSQE